MMKKTIYFLPGAMCDDALWQNVFPLLSPELSPVALTLPPLGSIDDIVKQLAANLLQYCPELPINLVGFSMGGYIASSLAVQAPAKIKQLMIIANTPMALPANEVTQRARIVSAVEKYGYSGIPSQRIAQLLAPCNANKQSIINTIKAMDKRGGQQMLLNQFKGATTRVDLLAQLDGAAFSSCFVYGDQDNLVNHQAINSLSSERITLQTIDNCGHMSPLEAPQAVADSINRYFS
ncbi:MAG: alpha/beta hydrolase [Psychrobium sp.]|nr:alpha/beta hydrolase [Psychrobium sp.]